MSVVRHSKLAKKDLKEIWRFISRDNRGEADRFLLRIEELCRSIADRPMIGRARDAILTDLRSFPVGNYVIFYDCIPEGIEIVRIVHGSRDLPALFAPTHDTLWKPGSE